MTEEIKNGFTFKFVEPTDDGPHCKGIVIYFKDEVKSLNVAFEFDRAGWDFNKEESLSKFLNAFILPALGEMLVEHLK